ncbi:uncharacterized protein YkwD [Arthrobacter sp. UYCu511]|uniref:CAP domain-containing protein n=1 Tax=Arthrobacter sp. UYCu511 TaxID=3156337 RepID=UPI003391F537
MRKIASLLCTVAASAVLATSGFSPALAQSPAPPSTPSPTSSAAPFSTPRTTADPSPTASPAATTSTGAEPAPAEETGAAVASSSPIMTADIAATTPAKSPVARALSGIYVPDAKDVFASKVLARANSYRAQNGAAPLVLNTAISAGSQEWVLKLNGQINADTLDMAKLHRPDYGASILPAGFDTYSEIIGINNTAEQIVDWWMNSPGHRAALMDKRFTDFGLGYVKTSKVGWSGMSVVAGNLARYPATLPTPAPSTPAPSTPAPSNPAPNSGPVFAAGDIAAVNSAGSLYVYPSAKGGDLWQSKFISAGWAGVQQLTVVDYNNDGIQDLVAVWSDGRLTVSFGQTNGTLKAAQKIGTGWGPLDVVITNWKSGSVYPSIVAKNRTTGQLFLYPNLDGVRFGARQQIGQGWGSLTIMAADFDGDKRQDLLARSTAGKLLLYRGNGAGGFISETRRQVGTGWGSMTHLSGISNHVGAGTYGVLARSSSGNLLYYPILRNSWGSKVQIGTGGWSALKLGS